MRNLKDLFEQEIKDLYAAEKQLVIAIPLMIQAASHQKLKRVFTNHLAETENHCVRLRDILSVLNIVTSDTMSHGMSGLIAESLDIFKIETASYVRDAALIASAQRIEHYEMSGYGTARHYAETLGYHDIMEVLDHILDEESNANDILNDLAVGEVNEKAMASVTI